MSEEDIKMIVKLLGSINIKLDKLVNLLTKEMAKEIVETLKAEEGETSAPVRLESNDSKGNVITDSKPSEVVLMDLTEVTVMAHTAKAILATKKGKQKWVPISCIVEGSGEWEDGVYFNNIPLTDEGKWINKKSWEPYEVRKR